MPRGDGTGPPSGGDPGSGRGIGRGGRGAGRLVGRGAEGIIPGCTELRLLIQSSDIDVPVFDTTQLHAEADPCRSKKSRE